MNLQQLLMVATGVYLVFLCAAVGAQVDTTKLGAAKTESILTKARKSK